MPAPVAGQRGAPIGGASKAAGGAKRATDRLLQGRSSKCRRVLQRVWRAMSATMRGVARCWRLAAPTAAPDRKTCAARFLLHRGSAADAMPTRQGREVGERGRWPSAARLVACPPCQSAPVAPVRAPAACLCALPEPRSHQGRQQSGLPRCAPGWSSAGLKGHTGQCGGAGGLRERWRGGAKRSKARSSEVSPSRVGRVGNDARPRGRDLGNVTPALRHIRPFTSLQKRKVSGNTGR